jgi:hypothetical protein
MAIFNQFSVPAHVEYGDTIQMDDRDAPSIRVLRELPNRVIICYTEDTGYLCIFHREIGEYNSLADLVRAVDSLQPPEGLVDMVQTCLKYLPVELLHERFQGLSTEY